MNETSRPRNEWERVKFDQIDKFKGWLEGYGVNVADLDAQVLADLVNYIEVGVDEQFDLPVWEIAFMNSNSDIPGASQQLKICVDDEDGVQLDRLRAVTKMKVHGAELASIYFGRPIRMETFVSESGTPRAMVTWAGGQRVHFGEEILVVE